MAELDYQVALLLQHQFEREYKTSRKEVNSDYELARSLQEQFEHEFNVEQPSPSLVYDQLKSTQNSSKSLTDPSWELVDPTPDIHTLFMAFNQRFFWNKLLAVCVSWSKRMTTCAGICSYNGRGGMCSITLSEPLLKLRPRKDLVETLLHEMIHAYLFVTHNNRDRDGHGPEFHKHMFRINKESGTNITVYHNFHDEVRLYKQHWWRCNGPCQHRQPYFGTVKRATNRAPGPYDRWWGEHSRTCGGTFIKVKEPEKKVKFKGKESSGDIKNFIPVEKKSNNVTGFKDLMNKVNGKFNSSSTLIVTKTKNTNTLDNMFKPTLFNNTKQDQIKKVEQDGKNFTSDFLAVRNHWQNKFDNTNKRPLTSLEPTNSEKILKVSEAYGECPICSNRILINDLNDHVDICLHFREKVTEPEIVDLTKLENCKECPLCNKQIESFSFDGHVENCLSTLSDNFEGELSSDKDIQVPCLACGRKIFKNDLNSHLDECMSDIFEVEVDSKGSKDSANLQFSCPFCMKLVKEIEMKEHIDSCLTTVDNSLVNSLIERDF